MINQQGLDYIKGQMDIGISPQIIRQTLIKNGWQATDVDVMINKIIQNKVEVAASPIKASEEIIQDTIIAPSQTGRSKFKIMVPVLVLLLIIGVVGSVYYFFYSPQKILARMAGKVQTINTASYTFDVKSEIKNTGILPQEVTRLFSPILAQNKVFKQVAGLSDSVYQTADLTTTTNSNSTMSLSISGQTDSTDLTKPKLSTIINASYTSPSEPAMALASEIRFIENNLYFKVDQMPEVGIDIKPFLGQWFKVDAAEVSDMTGTDIKKEFTPEQAKKTREVYTRNTFLKITKGPKFEKVGTDATFHYEYKLDKTKLKAFINDYIKTVLADPSIESEMNIYADSVDSLPEITGNIWVGIFDSYLRKLDLTFAMDDSDGSLVAGSTSIGMSLKDINEPVTIEVPKETKSYKELISTFQSKAMSDYAESSGSRDTDNDGLPDVYESLWRTKQDVADTDGDGFSDGAEVCGGFDPITPGSAKATTEQQGYPKSPSCTK